MGRTSDARDRLLSSGMRLLHARSYGAVTVDDICTAAAVNKGSFYHYFPSKQALAVAAIDTQWGRTRTTLLEPAFSSDVPPLERIVRLFHLAAGMHQARFDTGGKVLGCAFGNLALELSTQDPLVLAALRAVFEGFCSYFTTALLEAQAAGELSIADVGVTARGCSPFLRARILLLAKTENDAQVMSNGLPRKPSRWLAIPSRHKLHTRLGLRHIAPARRERAVRPPEPQPPVAVTAAASEEC